MSAEEINPNLSSYQFRGVDTSAPQRFPQDSDLKRNYRTFEPHELTATQDYVDPDHHAVKSFNPSFAKRVQVVAVDGENYISDGHHRAVGMARTGKPIKAVVWSARK